MATKNNKEQELKQAQTINSSEFENTNYLVINYLHPPDKENGIYAGQDLWLIAETYDENQESYNYIWRIDRGEFKGNRSMEARGNPICIVTNAVEGEINVTVQRENVDEKPARLNLTIREPRIGDLKGNFDSKMDDLREGITGGLSVSLQRTSFPTTNDIALWVVIRKSTEALSFTNYNHFINSVLYGRDKNSLSFSSAYGDEIDVYKNLRKRRFLPFNDTDAYRLLKVATESFLLVNSGVKPFQPDFAFSDADVSSINERLGDVGFNSARITKFWNEYLTESNGSKDPMLPYLAIIRSKLKNEELRSLMISNEQSFDDDSAVVRVLRNKMMNPFLFELIWSYWQEEGMLVQTMNAISRRFQNMRSSRGRRDPLATLEIDTLRPLSNLLWGYVQDEQHRLTIARRDCEYDHHYGMCLKGRAVPKLRSVDSRSKFIGAFHHLLQLSTTFFKQDDDTTVHADGFPLLNALREVHLVLSQGAHNQFGDLPSTARQEMLIQQWILARPEFREFLPTRNAVAYPEIWMDRVEAMKSLQGWNDTSIIHFHNLAVFGERILLSIRYGAWSDIHLPAQAANWARFWRAEMQGYIHAYRAVTGVDLSSTSSDRVDSVPPSVHLYNRYMNRSRRY
jgi:hypothetical protein